VLYKKVGGDHLASKKDYPVIKAIPFESLHKWQGCLVKDPGSGGGARMLHVKGAPERVLAMCSQSLLGGKEVAIDAAQWGAKVAEYASKGLRVLAVARWAPPPQWKGEAEVSVEWAASQSPPFLTLVALMAILDPPRPECVEAIAEFHRAGIVVKMITGDHPGVALAIGQKLGLADPTGQVSTGPEVDRMSDSELAARVVQCNVYARASPDNKIRIVKALQSHKQVVSMTGDGVNDAPSLKAADVGVAMGITGTDVSKEAAKIVLQDDNFATIVKAVKEGRKVWDNLQKVFLYNLPTNFAQGFVVFFAFVLKMHHSPLTPIQVLYTNMVLAISLGIALSSEVPEAGVMDRKPRSSSLPLVSPHIVLRTLWVTSTLVVAILGFFQWAQSQGFDIGRARAGAFTLLVVSSTLYGLSCRSTVEFALGPSLFRPNVFFWVSFLCLLGAQAFIVHTEGVNRYFSCEGDEVLHGQCSPMGTEEWAPIALISAAVFFAVETEKALVAAFSGSSSKSKSIKDKSA
jgi:magnesium-transporting ATPase (P-type)